MVFNGERHVHIVVRCLTRKSYEETIESFAKKYPDDNAPNKFTPVMLKLVFRNLQRRALMCKNTFL